MYNPSIIYIATSILFYCLPLLCSSPFCCISSPSLRTTAFPSCLFLSSCSCLYLPRLQKAAIPTTDLSTAQFIVLLQIPPHSSPWPWCLENTWQYVLSCWLMQLHHFLTLHIGLLPYVLDLDCKALCRCAYRAKLNLSVPTIVQWVNSNNEINTFGKIWGKELVSEAFWRRFPLSSIKGTSTELPLL